MLSSDVVFRSITFPRLAKHQVLSKSLTAVCCYPDLSFFKFCFFRAPLWFEFAATTETKQQSDPSSSLRLVRGAVYQALQQAVPSWMEINCMSLQVRPNLHSACLLPVPIRQKRDPTKLIHTRTFSPQLASKLLFFKN